MKTNICVAILLMASSLQAGGQVSDYNFRRDLVGLSDTWHKLEIPNEMFGKMNPGLSDLRIFGITENKDTIEAPYVLHIATDRNIRQEINTELINQSTGENGYYYTFKIAAENPVNHLDLKFKQQNFDWNVSIEGSQDQQEWYTIITDYRILSIKNENTDYAFTDVKFPDCKYRYLRLLIRANETPELITAKLTEKKLIPGKCRKYNIDEMEIEEKTNLRQTVVQISFPSAVPVSYLKVNIIDTFDFYRPVSIEYLSDSIKTDKGWKYIFRQLTSGTISSLEANEFKFKSTLTKALKLIIQNDNNTPLKLDSVEAKGNIHELKIRFTQTADYFLVYGSPQARRPVYDIANFPERIPDKLTEISVGNEQEILTDSKPDTRPLFMSKYWLWAILVFVILMLGWFSVRMMRK